MLSDCGDWGIRYRGKGGHRRRMARKRAISRFHAQTVPCDSPILKDVLLIQNRGRRPLRIWVFVANITDELILGLDILRAYDASVDIRRQKLRLAEEEEQGAGSRPSSLDVAKDHVTTPQCKGILMARMESPLGVENGLVEPSP
jgi:hypothetical protein